MEIEKVFEKLLKNKIKFVLIGGTALIGYGSTRVTFDTDIAVKTVDLDKIIELLYDINLNTVCFFVAIYNNSSFSFSMLSTSRQNFKKSS